MYAVYTPDIINFPKNKKESNLKNIFWMEKLKKFLSKIYSLQRFLSLIKLSFCKNIQKNIKLNV